MSHDMTSVQPRLLRAARMSMNDRLIGQPPS
jgi:hypothetical protein